MSDLANLILYQETVQTEFNSGMTTLAKSWFSVVSSEAVQNTDFSNSSKHSSQSIMLQASLRVKITSVEDNF